MDTHDGHMERCSIPSALWSLLASPLRAAAPGRRLARGFWGVHRFCALLSRDSYGVRYIVSVRHPIRHRGPVDAGEQNMYDVNSGAVSSRV